MPDHALDRPRACDATKLKQITEDIDDARVFGGIHFRFDQEAGADMGRRVNDFIYKQYLGNVRGCNCEASTETGNRRPRP